MKKLIAASAAAMIVATPAFAQATDSFDINASVADTCTMEGIGDINLNQLSIDTTAGSDALLINAGAYGQAGSFWLSCNETNSMTVVPTNGRLVNTTRSLQPGDDAGFKDRINYSVAAQNYFYSGGQPRWNSLAGAQNQTLSRGAIHRQINMAAHIAEAENQDARPLAGVYRDTVTVTVSIL